MAGELDTTSAGSRPMRTIPDQYRSVGMTDPHNSADRTCVRLRHQIALSTLMDDLVVASLAASVAAFRDNGVSDLEALEHMIRAHRIAVLKQGAILGAAGIDM